jgi:hypothetical protein
MTNTLVEDTHKLIKYRPAFISLKLIARDTKISYNWISSFHQGKINNPKIQRLQLLHDYLIEKCRQSA